MPIATKSKPAAKYYVQNRRGRKVLVKNGNERRNAILSALALGAAAATVAAIATRGHDRRAINAFDDVTDAKFRQLSKEMDQTGRKLDADAARLDRQHQEHLDWLADQPRRQAEATRKAKQESRDQIREILNTGGNRNTGGQVSPSGNPMRTVTQPPAQFGRY